MLTCSCPEYDGDGWYYIPADWFKPLNTARRKRCCSCQTLIDIGSESLEMTRGRASYGQVEEKIYGEEIELASWYMCEVCGEQFLNLEALGYCLDITSNMLNCLAEYRELSHRS